MKYLAPYKKQIAGALLCMLTYSLCNISLVPIIGRLSSIIGAKDFGMLNLVAIGVFCLALVRGATAYGQGYLMAYAGHRLVTDLRIQLYKHLQDLSLDFFSKMKTGEVMSRAGSDIQNLQLAVISSVTDIMPNLITLVGVLGYIFYLNWRLTLIAMIVVPLISFAITKFGDEMRHISRAAQQKAADVTSIVQEKISGVKLVKSFAMEKDEINKFSREAEMSFGLNLKQSQINVTQSPVLAFLNILAVIAVVWFGGMEVVAGRLTPENLIAFFAGIALIAEPISKLSTISTTIQGALASAERVFEIIDIQPTVIELPTAKDIQSIAGRVEFKGVDFAYEKGQPVLKDISFTAEPGKIIALVGKSGSGKSTLINLIPRFYDVNSGEVLIDALNVNKFTLNSLRRQIGMVSQETILFSGTVRDNIAYARTDASLEEVEKVAKMANAHEFIAKLPEGYETLVGERGVRLSGGERQRIAIARALLRDPRILIFDEATSALDTESERLVQEAMDRLMSGRTVIVIAHRLSTVQHADQILVMDQGKIVERGRHDQLLAQNGIYQKLYNLQFRD
jgi:subfamily B ATP-binding cassette protein MsbA